MLLFYSNIKSQDEFQLNLVINDPNLNPNNYFAIFVSCKN